LFRDYVNELFVVENRLDGKSLCHSGTLFVDDGKQCPMNLTVSAHKSQWFRNGGHVLVIDCIRSALKSGGGVSFAEAGACNSANSVLLEVAETFAEKVREQLENDESLKKLLGSPAFVPFLFSTWMNSNAWPETLKAVRGVFCPGDVDGENNIDHHKSILQTLNSNCVKDEDKQTEFKDELEKDDFEIDDPDDKRRILLARDRQKNIGDVTCLSVAKIISARARNFSKRKVTSETRKSRPRKTSFLFFGM